MNTARGTSAPFARSPIDLTKNGQVSEIVEDINERNIVIADRSRRRRFGIKGPGAEVWLAKRGYAVPGSYNNWVVAQEVLVGRVATSEFLVESLSVDGKPSAARVANGAAELGLVTELGLVSCPAGVYPVARQDLALELRGLGLGALLRQICSVDFAPLFAAPVTADGTVSGPLVLTSMIGVSVIAVARGVDRAASELLLWVDPSFAHYFWTTLITVAKDIRSDMQ